MHPLKRLAVFADDRGYLINLAQSVTYAIVASSVLGAAIGIAVWLVVFAVSTVLRWVALRQASVTNPILSAGASFYIVAAFSAGNAVIGLIGPLLGYGRWTPTVLGLSLASVFGAALALNQGLLLFRDHYDRRAVGGALFRAAAVRRLEDALGRHRQGLDARRAEEDRR